MTSKTYYSKDNKSYTGHRYARNCAGRSVWTVVINKSGNVSESLKSINYTGKMEPNGDDVELWIYNTRGW